MYEGLSGEVGQKQVRYLIKLAVFLYISRAVRRVFKNFTRITQAIGNIILAAQFSQLESAKAALFKFPHQRFYVKGSPAK